MSQRIAQAGEARYRGRQPHVLVICCRYFLPTNTSIGLQPYRFLTRRYIFQKFLMQIIELPSLFLRKLWSQEECMWSYQWSSPTQQSFKRRRSNEQERNTSSWLHVPNWRWLKKNQMQAISTFFCSPNSWGGEQEISTSQGMTLFVYFSYYYAILCISSSISKFL